MILVLMDVEVEAGDGLYMHLSQDKKKGDAFKYRFGKAAAYITHINEEVEKKNKKERKNNV